MKPLPAPALLALVALGLAAADAPPAHEAAFKDWMAVCDNVRRCTALGWAAGEEAGGGPFLWLQRDGAAASSARVIVGLGWSEEAEAVPVGARAELRVTGPRGERLFRGTVEEDDLDARVVRLASAADESRLAAALKDGERAAVTAGGKPMGEISLSGSSAALRWVDERQGRAGTLTALVATGSRPFTAAPPAPPVVKLVRPAGEETEVAALPAVLARRADVKACQEDQDDPEGEFGKPTIHPLGGGDFLWAIPCGRGAYNFSSFYLIAGREGANARSPGLGDGDILVNGGFGGGMLGAFAKGRGLGDCGEAVQYAWDGRRFQLVERVAMGECRGVPMSLWPRYWTATVK